MCKLPGAAKVYGLQSPGILSLVCRLIGLTEMVVLLCDPVSSNVGLEDEKVRRTGCRYMYAQSHIVAYFCLSRVTKRNAWSRDRIEVYLLYLKESMHE